jgi:hypothetical protein
MHREALALRGTVHTPGDPHMLEVDVALVNALTTQGKAEEANALTARIAPLLNASTSPNAEELRARLAGH